MKPSLAAFGIAAVLLSAVAEGRGKRRTVYNFPDQARDAYVLALDDQSVIMNESIEALKTFRNHYAGDVLWFRRHGETYIVRERGKLDQARGLFTEMRALEPEQRDLARRQRLADRREESIDRQRDAIEDRDEDRTDRDASADPGRIRELDEALAEVKTESRRLDEEERALDRRSEALEAAAETKLWNLIDGWIASGAAQRASQP